MADNTDIPVKKDNSTIKAVIRLGLVMAAIVFGVMMLRKFVR